MLYQIETLLNLQEAQAINGRHYLNNQQYNTLHYFDLYIDVSTINKHLKKTVES